MSSDIAELCSATANQLEKLLFKVYELEVTLSHAQTGEDVLSEYLHELSETQKVGLTLPQDLKVPVELLRYVDEGGHPDIFTSNIFKACLADNQAAKGKVAAFRQFKDSLRQHAAEVFPEEMESFGLLLNSDKAAGDKPELKQEQTNA